MIDILVPVLGRPHRAQPLVDNIHWATVMPHRIWFICSADDPEQLEACAATGEETGWIVGPQEHEYPRKINFGFSVTGDLDMFPPPKRKDVYPYVFNASDDLEFEHGWDLSAVALAGTDYHVVATNDRANSQVKKGRFGTHCLIRREYIDQRGGSLDGPGHVLHEGYDHNFVDRELCHLAQYRGVYAFAQRSIVKHHHPLHDSHVRMDATYKKGLRNFQADQRLFFQRAAQWDYHGLNPAERRVARNMLAKKAKR